MVLCKDCKYCDVEGRSRYSLWYDYCDHPSCFEFVRFNPVTGQKETERILRCSDKNKNLDCKDFIKKKKWWQLK